MTIRQNQRSGTWIRDIRQHWIPDIQGKQERLAASSKGAVSLNPLSLWQIAKYCKFNWPLISETFSDWNFNSFNFIYKTNTDVCPGKRPEKNTHSTSQAAADKPFWGRAFLVKCRNIFLQLCGLLMSHSLFHDLSFLPDCFLHYLSVSLCLFGLLCVRSSDCFAASHIYPREFWISEPSFWIRVPVPGLNSLCFSSWSAVQASLIRKITSLFAFA